MASLSHQLRWWPGSSLLCPLQAQPDPEAELAVVAPGSKALSIQLFLLQVIQYESTIWGSSTALLNM